MIQSPTTARDRDHRPVPRLHNLLPVVVVVALVCPPPAAAQTGSVRIRERLAGGATVWLDTRVELEPIGGFDLDAGDGRAARRRSASGGAEPAGRGALVVRLPEPQAPIPASPIRRHVAQLWRATLPAGVDASAVQIDVEVFSLGGERGRFSHEANPASHIGVRVLEDPVRRLPEPSGVMSLEGGATFELDIRDALEPGRYGGTVRITLTQM